MRKDSFDAISEEAIRKMMQDEYASVSASEQLIQRTLKAINTELESQNNDQKVNTKTNKVLTIQPKWWPGYAHAALVAAGLVMVLIVGTIWFPRISSRDSESPTMAARADGRGVAESGDMTNGAYKTAAAETTAAAMPAGDALGSNDSSVTVSFSESSPDAKYGITSAFSIALDSVDMSMFESVDSIPPANVIEQVKLLQPQLPEGAIPQTENITTIQTLNPGILLNNDEMVITSNDQILSGKSYLMIPVVDTSSLFIGTIPLFYSKVDLGTLSNLYPGVTLLDNSGWLTTGFVPTSSIENPSVLTDPKVQRKLIAEFVRETVPNVKVVDIGSGQQFALLFRAQNKDWIIPFLQMPIQTQNGVAYETQEFIKLIKSNP